GRPDMSRPELDRRTVVAMLEAAAFGHMPKDQPLAEPERTRFIEVFIPSLWTGADAEAARGYFVDRSSAMPAYRPEVTFALIHDIAKAPGATSWRMMENAVRSNVQQLTPGLITVTGLEAIEACRATSKTREQ